MDIHHIPPAAIVFAIVGAVLLLGPAWGRKPASDAAASADERRRARQRVAVYRSAGVSLLILAIISYLTS